MSFDTYVIDEAAARADISKMNQAVQHLNQARRTVVQLMSEAQSMEGQTGQAIYEKAQELQYRIDRLVRQLQNSGALIQRTVSHYQQLDNEHAIRIRRS